MALSTSEHGPVPHGEPNRTDVQLASRGHPCKAANCSATLTEVFRDFPQF